jgi:hypothetical protein
MFLTMPLTTVPSLRLASSCFALLAGGSFQHGAARHDDVVALAVELDDLEFEFLVLVGRGVLDRTHVDQRTGQEGADAVGHDGEAALHLAVDDALHQGAFVEGLLEVVPGGDALGLLARQAGLAIAVLEHLDGDADVVAGLDLDFAAVVAEFIDGDEALGLEAGVDHHEVLVDADDFRGDHFTRAHLLAGQAFFEEGGETFLADGRGGSCNGHKLLEKTQCRPKSVGVSVEQNREAKALRGTFASGTLLQGAAACGKPCLARSITQETASSTVMAVVSSSSASAHFCRGATARALSRASRSRRSCKRVPM